MGLEEVHFGAFELFVSAFIEHVAVVKIHVLDVLYLLVLNLLLFYSSSCLRVLQKLLEVVFLFLFNLFNFAYLRIDKDFIEHYLTLLVSLIGKIRNLGH